MVRTPSVLVITAALSLAVVLPDRLAAQDFLFAPPAGGVTVTTGLWLAEGGSDVHAFLQDHFTLSNRDFNGAVVAVELAGRVSDRVDLLGALSFGWTSADSEYRDYIAEDGLPIRQSLRLTHLPALAGLKLYLLPRGRSVGRLAWIPTRFTGYVTATGGALRYDLRQRGEFVDFRDMVIFEGRARSNGFAPAAQLGGGIELRLGPRAALVLDGRRQWARASARGDLADLGRIDLGGTQVTLGIHGRF